MDDETADLMRGRANKVVDLVRKRAGLRSAMQRVTAGRTARDAVECVAETLGQGRVNFSIPLQVVVDDLLERLEIVDAELEALGWRALAAPESAGQ